MAPPPPHRMRITSGGDMAGYVSFALSFLRDNDRPLVLHTLPPTPSPSKGKSKDDGKSTLQACTLSTPRLVSVVEKVKREFGGELWQYTESGVLPAPKAAVSLERALGGRTRPKMTHRAYLVVTVSKVPLGLEKGRNVTCQHVGGRLGGGGKRGAEDSLPASKRPRVGV